LYGSILLHMVFSIKFLVSIMCCHLGMTHDTKGYEHQAIEHYA